MKLIDADDLKKELLAMGFFPAFVKYAIDKCRAVEVQHGRMDCEKNENETQ